MLASTSEELPAVACEVQPPPLTGPVRPKRSYKRWIAAALSFLAPGFGQIYNRDYLRGIVWLIITPGFWVGSAGLFGWPFHLMAAYTAYQRAQRSSTSPNVSPSGLPGRSFLRRPDPASARRRTVPDLR